MADPKYKTPEYQAWRNIRFMCSDNPAHSRWHRYGGRGIRVCERWQGSFDAFLADVGPRPANGWWLTRVDGDGHYEPGNVVWAEPKAAMAKRGDYERRGRPPRMVEWKGERRAMEDLCKEHGVMADTVRWRIRRGWDLERALTTPVRRYEK
jgi:hypothetical protein